MVDPRIKILAKNLINYSCELKKGEKVLIETIGLETPLVNELIKEAYNVGALPFVTIKDKTVDRALLMNITEDHAKQIAKYEAIRMEEMDAYIGIRSGNNVSELSDVPGNKMEIYFKYIWNEVHSKIRVPKTKWVVLRYPSPSMAQMADLSTEAFEDFYFNVCNLDYSKMSKAMDSLVNLMQN